MAEQNNNASSTEEVRLPPVNMRKFRIMSIWFVRFFFVLLFSCFILSLIIPLRPKYSESEKRELAKFPKFTFTALVSGKYFDGINSWYSDTFPLREKLTDINAFFTGLYGKSDVRIQGDVETGDDIPESHPDDSSGTASDTSSDASSAESSEPSKADGTSSASSSAPSEAPKPQTPPQTQTTQTLGALLINAARPGLAARPLAILLEPGAIGTHGVDGGFHGVGLLQNDFGALCRDGFGELFRGDPLQFTFKAIIRIGDFVKELVHIAMNSGVLFSNSIVGSDKPINMLQGCFQGGSLSFVLLG